MTTHANHEHPAGQNRRASETWGRPLRRAADGRIVAGVAAGLAAHFDVDVVLVRLVLVALMLIGGAGVALYLAAWLLVPEQGSDTSLLDQALHSRSLT